MKKVPDPIIPGWGYMKLDAEEQSFGLKLSHCKILYPFRPVRVRENGLEWPRELPVFWTPRNIRQISAKMVLS